MCIFCKIAAHEIPSKIVYEDDKFIAFLDLSQTTKGHTLVVPKRHSKNIYELNEEDAREALVVVKKVALMLKKAYSPIGINIVNNNERPLQSVEHFHIHLIPRYENDDFDILFKDHSKESDLDKTLNEILEK
jgi:histidine triad (HIT) family protein